MIVDRLLPALAPGRLASKVTNVDITNLGFRPRIQRTGTVEEVSPGNFVLGENAFLALSYNTKKDEQGRRI